MTKNIVDPKHASVSPLSAALKAVDAVETADRQVGEFTKELLTTREKSHGDFARNARISQDIKTSFVSYMLDSNAKFTPVQCEVLDMIALKLSRIFSGHADFNDHWDDIAGYAQLVSEDNLRNATKTEL